jgi:hypothetical protein
MKNRKHFDVDFLPHLPTFASELTKRERHTGKKASHIGKHVGSKSIKNQNEHERTTRGWEKSWRNRGRKLF